MAQFFALFLVSGKAENTDTNGGISKTPSQLDDNGVVNKECVLSGKMKKNAQKWKSFSMSLFFLNLIKMLLY